MTSLVASRHNNPHSYTPQEALVSAGSHSQIPSEQFTFSCQILSSVLESVPPFSVPLQSSSSPVEGEHTEAASHSENGTKTDSQEGTIVGEDTLSSPQPLVKRKQSLDL